MTLLHNYSPKYVVKINDPECMTLMNFLQSHFSIAIIVNIEIAKSDLQILPIAITPSLVVCVCVYVSVSNILMSIAR